MYYYCRNTLVCDPKGNMNPFNPLPLVGGADTCQECWVAQPNHYDAQGNYLKSCVHDWATIFSNRIQWKRLTVRNSQSSWFTCFAQDQCRQECRAAFGAFCLFCFFGVSFVSFCFWLVNPLNVVFLLFLFLLLLCAPVAGTYGGSSSSSSRKGLSTAQTNSMLQAWLEGLKKNTQGWTGLGRSILSNIVTPNTATVYTDGTFFPRSTHYLYGPNTGDAKHSDDIFQGRRDIGKSFFNVLFFWGESNIWFGVVGSTLMPLYNCCFVFELQERFEPMAM